MMEHPVSHSEPVLKIGAVVLRADTGSVLIMQPIPKTQGEIPPFVLPRGSRQYSTLQPDGSVIWQDARDVETGREHAATLEPFMRGLEREIEEEAGLTVQDLAEARVTELGTLPFQSRRKGIYPIHWFLVVINGEKAETLIQQTPVDALSIRWATLDEIKQLAAQGHFSAGYLEVIQMALAHADGAV